MKDDNPKSDKHTSKNTLTDLLRTRIPFPGLFISAIAGLTVGICLEWMAQWNNFPKVVIVTLVFCLVIGGIVEIISYLVRKHSRKFLAVSTLEQMPVSIADFLNLVIKKMKYRKEVRAEVLAELAGHFEDELKECKTDEQKQQKARKLIGEFGEAETLGILLRRAKKRCRPLWRTIAARCFQAVGVLFLLLILYTIWFFTAKPVVRVNYVAELNKLARPSAEESENAGVFYEKAIQLLKAKQAKPDYNDIKEIAGKRYDEATPEEKEKLKMWIASNEKIFDLIAEGTKRPYYWQTYKTNDPNSGILGILLPELAEIRKIARFLIWRARFSAEEGRFNASFDDLFITYRFGKHLKKEPFLVSQLVGIAVEALSAGTLKNILNNYNINAESLSMLQENLQLAIANENFTINLTGEKLFLYDEIQRCFTEDFIGSGRICFAGLKRIKRLSSSPGSQEASELDFLPYVFTQPNREKTKQDVDALYSFWAELTKKTPYQIHIEKIDIENKLKEIRKGNILLGILAPAINRVIELSYRNKTNVYATLTIISLMRYKQEKGQYPESLEEVVSSGFLKELPMDPWSDKPLIYKKTADGFTLYSVGLNFKDDGGILGRNDRGQTSLWNTENGDAVFWPVIKEEK